MCINTYEWNMNVNDISWVFYFFSAVFSFGFFEYLFQFIYFNVYCLYINFPFKLRISYIYIVYSNHISKLSSWLDEIISTTWYVYMKALRFSFHIFQSITNVVGEMLKVKWSLLVQRQVVDTRSRVSNIVIKRLIAPLAKKAWVARVA